MRRIRAAAIGAAACLTLAACSSPAPPKKETPRQVPAAKTETVPEVFQVKIETSKGDMVIEVHRAWAPIGVDHFHYLVRTGFFDQARFFRVPRGFIAQFGIAADPSVNRIWSNSALKDDPEKEHNVEGTVTFAKTGPHSRTTQLFINLADNRKLLDGQGFVPIGKVVSGLAVASFFYDGYGEVAPRGTGPDPMQIAAQGNDYLAAQFPRLDFIKKAIIQ
jgi:peptidyl-prolyl cis-trans isomerase A (cyclophilin A)